MIGMQYRRSVIRITASHGHRQRIDHEIVILAGVDGSADNPP
jgi:hypothetical protein